MTYEVQMSIPYFSGLPKDVVTNVFHFDWTGGSAPTNTNLTALADTCSAFYEDIWPTASADGYAAFMRPGLTKRKIYDLSQPKPRVPIFSDIDSLAVKTGILGVLPTEVAIVASFHGGFVSGTHPGRRRGRVYLGGLGSSITAGGTTAYPTISSSLRTVICTAMSNMAAKVGTTSWRWVVYSRANEAAVPVIGGWVDDTPDTQRRRGVATSTRTTWGSITPP